VNCKLTKTQRRQRQQPMEIWVKEGINLEFPIRNKYKNSLARES